MSTIEVTELLGDGIGPELRESVYAIAKVLPLDLKFIPFDLSVENRESGNSRELFEQVYQSMNRTKLAIKYPTVTKSSSPNAIIRRMCDFSVILRPVVSIKGIKTNFSAPLELYVVRVATGGTYDDPGQMIGKDAAASLRIVERTPVRQAARFAFNLARDKKLTVTSSSKHTIQRTTDGFFQKIVDEVHQDFKDVQHQIELFDALLAKIILKPEKYQVVVVLNEYGDFLSDMACGLIGSIGIGASGNYSFVSEGKTDRVDIAMFDPSGGTAPDIAGQDKCNPTAMLLAFGMMLDQINRVDLGQKLRIALYSSIADGDCTSDIGGKMKTREFTRMVADKLKDSL
jgi:isocitrate dehydrogenase (NAD+)